MRPSIDEIRFELNESDVDSFQSRAKRRFTLRGERVNFNVWDALTFIIFSFEDQKEMMRRFEERRDMFGHVKVPYEAGPRLRKLFESSGFEDEYTHKIDYDRVPPRLNIPGVGKATFVRVLIASSYLWKVNMFMEDLYMQCRETYRMEDYPDLPKRTVKALTLCHLCLNFWLAGRDSAFKIDMVRSVLDSIDGVAGRFKIDAEESPVTWAFHHCLLYCSFARLDHPSAIRLTIKNAYEKTGGLVKPFLKKEYNDKAEQILRNSDDICDQAVVDGLKGDLHGLLSKGSTKQWFRTYAAMVQEFNDENFVFFDTDIDYANRMVRLMGYCHLLEILLREIDDDVASDFACDGLSDILGRDVEYDSKGKIFKIERAHNSPFGQSRRCVDPSS